jgi:hypothetical protein
LIALDERGASSATWHSLTAPEACGRDVPKPSPVPSKLERVEIGPEAVGSRTIVLDVNPSGDSRCVRHTLQLNSKSDFQPAKVEIHIQKKPTRGMKRKGYPDIPPPQQ